MDNMDENKSGMRTQRTFACCGSTGLASCGVMLVKCDPGDEEGSHFCKSVESDIGVSIYSVGNLILHKGICRNKNIAKLGGLGHGAS